MSDNQNLTHSDKSNYLLSKLNHLIKCGYVVYGGNTGHSLASLLTTVTHDALANDKRIYVCKLQASNNDELKPTLSHTDLIWLRQAGHCICQIRFTDGKIDYYAGVSPKNEAQLDDSRFVAANLKHHLTKGNANSVFAKKLADTPAANVLTLANPQVIIKNLNGLSEYEIEKLLARLENWLAKSPWLTYDSSARSASLGITVFLKMIPLADGKTYYEFQVDDLDDFATTLLQVYFPTDILFYNLPAVDW